MDEPDSQFLPTSLTSMRRTSTGSLMRKRTSTSQSHDYASCSTYRDYASVRARKTPITVGGSWDDNSVGHGSVAARMRRERNKAIRRTQSTATYTNNPVDTHACVTSTLNLINTTSLSPWKHHERLPWDEDYGLQCGSGTQSAAAKRSAGSLCNISSAMTSHCWDSRSIPDYSKMSGSQQGNFRHSFTSANHHSSPTSGCASIASSDLDSADLAFFSMNDDSSLFDGDSLFSDTYGVMDADSGFSSNIFSLLEEGTISCRTPFLNGDWPDSISELDFDCSEQQNDISNCDAHSDIGPSCSVSSDRNKLKKRQIRSKSNALEYTDQKPFLSQNYSVEGNGVELPTDPDIYLTNPRSSSRTNGSVTQQSHDELMQQYVTNQQRHVRCKSPIKAASEHDRRPNLNLYLSCDDMLLKNGGLDERSEEPNTPVVETEMAVAPSEVQMPPVVLEQQKQLERQLQQQQQLANDMAAPLVLHPHLEQIQPVVLQHFQPHVQQKLQHAEVPTVIQQQHIFQPPLTQHIVAGLTSVIQQPILQHQKLQIQNSAAEPLQAVHQLQQQTTAETLTQFAARPTLYPSTDQTRKFATSNLDAPVQVQLRLNTATVATSSPNSTSKAPIVLSINNWNGMPQEKRLGFIEQLSERIKTTMGLQEKLEIINIIGAGNNEPTSSAPLCLSMDDIDSHKLSRVFGSLDNHQTSEDSPTKSEMPPKPPETNLRRSNSDGNLPKTVTDAQKENRRRQRQARKWAKLMKQRQRKENRQLMKEHKSGLFVNEKKVKIAVESEEEVDLTDI